MSAVRFSGSKLQGSKLQAKVDIGEPTSWGIRPHRRVAGGKEERRRRLQYNLRDVIGCSWFRMWG